MRRLLHSFVLSLFTLTALQLNAAAQVKKQAQEVKQIFKNKQLANGTRLTPDASINKVTFLKQYNANKELWDKAFDYLAKTDLDNAAPGKYAIAGDSVYAIVLEGPTKTPEQAKWESHLKYIDLQCVLKGAEIMQVTPLGTATLTNAYDAKTDNINYTATGKSYTVKPGQILLFFPDEVHRAGLKAEGFDTDKRVVIKIMVSK